MAQAAWSIHCIVGTGPNFVKIASIMRSLRARNDVRARLIHTGPPYDVAMRLGNRGLAHVRENFDREKLAARFLDILALAVMHKRVEPSS